MSNYSATAQNEQLNPQPEQNNFFPVKNEGKHKNVDPSILVTLKCRANLLIDYIQLLAPEKRARFERTADILARTGMLEVTVKTADLMQRNQQAQNELIQLKAEVEQFVQSVLANPENQVFASVMFMLCIKTCDLLQDKSRANARSVFLANPLNTDEIPASPKVSVIKLLPSPMSGPS